MWMTAYTNEAYTHTEIHTSGSTMVSSLSIGPWFLCTISNVFSALTPFDSIRG